MSHMSSRGAGFALAALAVMTAGLTVVGAEMPPDSDPKREPKFTGARIFDIDPDGTVTEITDLDESFSESITGTFVPATPLQTRAIVREFDAEEGWGVLDAPELPGGCWVHYSDIDGTGFRALTAGQLVNVEYEDLLALYGPGAQQDGYAFRATRVHS
ncbi:hypothetical protein E5720_10745 [Rhodococcus sp. PAMC28707]|nr:hypothetical protein E5769_03270 [Rhodococcus sp. PAMC28705]QCB58917.1 hypothetical protein E5720_10745 [Rhodococcus sp. PAMC28707]